jgi:hypothetical protein
VKELTDYSGDLLPEINFSDFSRETLEKLLVLYSKLYIAIDGFWYMTVMDKISNAVALECDIKTWMIMSKYEKKRISEVLNIQGNDVLAFVKTLQFSPWFIHTKYTVDMENSDSAVMTVTYCPTLDALEKEGKGRQKDICSIFEPQVFSNYASLFNSKIETKCLSPLPRDKREDICCKWSFKLSK